MSKCPADFNFFDERVLNCPYDFYQTLQEQAPVYQLPDTNIFMMTRYEDVRKLLKDTETYSNNFNHLLKGPEPAPEVTAIYGKAWQPVDTADYNGPASPQNLSHPREQGFQRQTRRCNGRLYDGHRARVDRQLY